MNAMTELPDFGDLDAWQAMLDRNSELFADMVSGSRIGFVSREASGILPGKHVEGVKQANEAPMLAWEVRDGAMSVRLERFTGMTTTQVDLLLVADDEAMAMMRGEVGANALSDIKRLIRHGRMIFFVFKNKYQLQDAGYEDFLDSLGLAFLGACR